MDYTIDLYGVKDSYFLVSLLFLCMHAYIKSREFIGSKGLRSLKYCHFARHVGLRVCAKFHDHT